MRILVVNNNTKHLDYLKKALTPYELEVVMYHPGAKLNWQDKDLVVLSGGGGEGNEINDIVDRGKLWYEDEMKLILECKKPIVGICMGFEVIARTFGSKVEEMDKIVQGYRKSKATKQGKLLLPVDYIRQYEAHKWRVKDAPKNFIALAKSNSGVEMMIHKNLPILATQFHPEKTKGTIKLKQLVELILTIEKGQLVRIT